jgi:hypothetical protein
VASNELIRVNVGGSACLAKSHAPSQNLWEFKYMAAKEGKFGGEGKQRMLRGVDIL